jgi:hypothetical protein
MPLSAASVPTELDVDQGLKEIFKDTQLCFYSVQQK